MKNFITLCLMLIISLHSFAQAGRQHVVKRGETFASIAKQYGTTEELLRAANPEKENCYVGLKLRIPQYGESFSATNSKIEERLSDGYYICNNYDRFSKELADEASKGNVVAIKELADCYRWGIRYAEDIPVETSPAKALDLYRKAASVDYPYAQWEIAQMYNAGSGVKRDVRQAQVWYDKAFTNFKIYAEERSDAKAMKYLGVFYSTPTIPGNKERLDFDEAIYWLREAVDKGEISAAVELATLCRLDRTSALGESEALKWDARFCIDAEKKGWFTDDYPSAKILNEAGHSKEDWETLAKDTYQPNVRPIKIVEMPQSEEELIAEVQKSTALSTANQPAQSVATEQTPQKDLPSGNTINYTSLYQFGVMIYLKAETGDEISASITSSQNGKIYFVNINNLEGWQVAASHFDSPIKYDGDHYVAGGPQYLMMAGTVNKPYVYFDKDFSWVKMSHLDGTYNKRISKEQFEKDRDAFQKKLQAQGIRPRHPAAEAMSNATRIADASMQSTKKMLQQAVDDAYKTSSDDKGSSTSFGSKCRICGGSGWCTSCRGFGDGRYTYGGTRMSSCSSCHGSRKCFNCHGTGRQ